MVDKIDKDHSLGSGFRPLSLTLSVVGFGALVAVGLSMLTYGFDAFTVSGAAAAVLFFSSNLWFSLTRHPQRWMPVLQAVEIAGIGLMAAVISDPTDYGGIALVAMTVPLFAKHGVIRSQRSLFALLAAALAIDVGLSYVIHDAPFRLVIAMAAIATGVYAIIHFAYYDEIISLLRDVSHLRATARESEKSVLQLRRELARARVIQDTARAEAQQAESRVRALEEQVNRYGAVGTAVDFEQFKLSEREIDVLRLLVQTRGRNRDIGNMLGITERTVKSHIYRICNKVGVDTRLELVELFRWNWSEESTDEAP